MRAARTRPVALVASLLCAGAGCSADRLYPSVKARPSIEIEAGTPPRAGRPIAMHFSWVVDPDFKPPARPHRVFVHFLLADGQLAFTDDHEPEPAVGRWKPGGVYEYTRTVVLPDRVRRLGVRVGLFSARFPYKARVLARDTRKPGFPTLAEFQVAENPDQAEEAVHLGRGFLPWVQDGRAMARSTSWTGRSATFAFLRRPEGTTLLLQGYTERARFSSDPTLTLRVGDLEVRQLIRDDNRRVVRLDIPGDGSTAIAEGTLAMDASFTAEGRTLAYCVERFRAISSSATGR
ncbi:MAG TPA: hypothetical protein VJU18_06570 [Vicinamibacteria bacterium]|nr:hypothetical protein [Vicinamibacteria bacterium]